MHGGCSGTFETGQQVLAKVRAMGFSEAALPIPFEIQCYHCGKEMVMETCEAACASCGAVHAVPPCHAHEPDAVRCAGPSSVKPDSSNV
jgi:hypothetical protein